MNEDEAKKVLELMKSADGGCVYCVRELFRQFVREFPEFAGLAEETFRGEFGEELEKGESDE